MRALVTGAVGFVGPHLARALRAAGREVVTTSRDGEGGADRALDVTSAASCRDAVRDVAPDEVYHLAGATHVEDAPEESYRVNVFGTLHLLQAVADAAPGARVVLPSSAYAYGQVPAAEQPIPESRPLRPSNHYGASKAALEAVASAFAARGLRVVVARSFNHVGPGQSPAFVVASLARQFAEAEAKGGVVHVGNLAPVRDFLDVRDVCAAYVALAERAPPGGVLNVCSGRGVAVADVVARFRKIFGDVRVEVEAARVRDQDVPALVGDPARLRELGWKPTRTLDETLADVAADWRARTRVVP